MALRASASASASASFASSFFLAALPLCYAHRHRRPAVAPIPSLARSSHAGSHLESVARPPAHPSSLLGSLTAAQASQVSVYVDTLLEWNQRMNLTAVTERSAVMERHIVDSLALLPVMEATYAEYNQNKKDLVNNVKIADIGSGAGLPGIIVAIARPSWDVTLMESLQKRCNFLEHVIDELGLSNVRVIRTRAEDAGQDIAYREVFDVAVARAVAEMRVLVELCLPLVRVGGLFLAAKGANPEVEVELAKRAAGILGATILPIVRVTSVSPNGQRTAILCYKKQETPKKYPRKPGTPQKQPL